MAKPYQVKQVRRVLFNITGRRGNDEIRSHPVLDSEDDAFIAEVPELAGCTQMAPHARSSRQRRGDIAEWMETARTWAFHPRAEGRLLFA